MRSSLLLLCITIFSGSIFAQDKIHLIKNDKVVEVVVVSIEDDIINYRKFNSKNKNVYSISVTDVSKIEYESGNEQFFPGTLTENNPEADSLKSTVVESADSQGGLKETMIPEGEEKDKKAFKMKLGLGLMVGATATTLKYEFENESVDLYNSYRFGPAGGLFLEWEIFRFMSLKSSLYYKDKGDQTDGTELISNWEFPDDNPIVYSAQGNGFINKNLGYLEWSLLPLFGYTNRDNSLQVQLGAGVYAAYGIHGKQVTDLYIEYFMNGEYDETEQVIKENPVVFTRDLIIDEKLPETLYYNQIDYGFIFYLGIKPRPFNLGLSLSMGQANILSTSVEELFYSGDNIQTASNFTFSFLFGYYL